MTCTNACMSKPGWFLPGEAEQAAALLDLGLVDFFKRYLGVDWWQREQGERSTFLLAPATLRSPPGAEYPFNPKGRCVFLQENGACAIYSARPHECRAYLHDQSDEVCEKRHRKVAEAWEAHQAQIVELLGREPELSEPEFMDLLTPLLGGFL